MTPDNPELPFDLDAALCRPTAWDQTVAAMHDMAATTCFFLAGGRDWEPLARLAQKCDVFIFANPHLNGEQAAESLRDVSYCNLGWRCMNIHKQSVDHSVGKMELAMLRYLQEHRPADAAAYGEVVRRLAAKQRRWVEVCLQSEFDEGMRNRHVLFVEAEALAVYRGVYAAARLAPQVVVLPSQSEHHLIYTPQLSISGPLGAVLSEGPRPLLLLAAEEDAGAMVGTPWPHLWTRLEGGRAAFTQWPLPTSWWSETPPLPPMPPTTGEV